MPRIQIKDLPTDMEIPREELKRLVGGALGCNALGYNALGYNALSYNSLNYNSLSASSSTPIRRPVVETFREMEEVELIGDNG